MFTDIFTIMWKEWKEMLLQRPNLRGGWLGLLVLIGVFGIFIPLQSGPDWVQSPANLALWAWVPFILVSAVVADSFAGERERHTLETLLASRLSDRAILLGKIAATLTYGWGLALASVLMGLATTNVIHGEGRLLLYPLPIGLGIVVLTFLVSALSAELGVLVSLRSSTVRQAQQAFNVGIFVILIPILAFPMLPEDLRTPITQFLINANSNTILFAAAILLLVVDAILLAIAEARFRRAKLILD
jgi:ABC-2 type transport system permease protein